ncbi:hypothetical protein HMPREF0208_03115 [Citrobacter koseri]|nr:hypothetical protein HMPREF3207_04785 [Citrobacter koseri]KWZ99282.1 hypothetical protein HMPREF3220_02201 [Citrobacter koseri]KXB42644.1 hypothetical protein HMPREF0208_03115 [Citrobacter koseri]
MTSNIVVSLPEKDKPAYCTRKYVSEQAFLSITAHFQANA